METTVVVLEKWVLSRTIDRLGHLEEANHLAKHFEPAAVWVCGGFLSSSDRLTW